MTTHPLNPIEAVTWPDPYQYYKGLVLHHPFYRDETLGMWVAASALAVKTVLTHPHALVRPVDEAVPKALLGTPIADIFGKLIRMNESNQKMLKPAVSKALAIPDRDQLVQSIKRLVQILLKELNFEAKPGDLTNFSLHLPVYVVASLLGLEDGQLFQISNYLKDYLQSLRVAASQIDQINRGKVAATHLLTTFYALLEDSQNYQKAELLLARFAREAHSAGCPEPAVIVANAIGFLSQTYEATAGLLGNTMVTLASYPRVRAQIIANPALLEQLVQEVLRYDAPIQNTRRFLSQNVTVAGHQLQKGETVLVVLAAANRDPSANFDPDRFDLFREKPQNFSFGIGQHACPGQHLAGLITKIAIEELLKAGLVPEQLAEPITYRPSANARIPIL